MTAGPKTMIEIVQNLAVNVGFPIEILGLIIVVFGCFLFLVINFEYGLIMTFLFTGLYLTLVLALGLPSFAAQMLFLSVLTIMILIIIMNPTRPGSVTP